MKVNSNSNRKLSPSFYYYLTIFTLTVISLINCTFGLPSLSSNNDTKSLVDGYPGELGLASSTNSDNETMELDFVNLPGYGVIDDANSTLNETFSCYEKRYGYYADVSKDCTVFHLCYPIRELVNHEIVYQRFSFVCSDNFVFDQRQLVCVDNETTPINCQESIDYYIPSNDRLIESLQQTQPDMFAEEEDTESVNNNNNNYNNNNNNNNNDSSIGELKSNTPLTSNIHNEYR